MLNLLNILNEIVQFPFLYCPLSIFISNKSIEPDDSILVEKGDNLSTVLNYQYL